MIQEINKFDPQLVWAALDVVSYHLAFVVHLFRFRWTEIRIFWGKRLRTYCFRTVLKLETGIKYRGKGLDIRRAL